MVWTQIHLTPKPITSHDFQWVFPLRLFVRVQLREETDHSFTHENTSLKDILLQVLLKGKPTQWEQGLWITLFRNPVLGQAHSSGPPEPAQWTPSSRQNVYLTQATPRWSYAPASGPTLDGSPLLTTEIPWTPMNEGPIRGSWVSLSPTTGMHVFSPPLWNGMESKPESLKNFYWPCLSFTLAP